MLALLATCAEGHVYLDPKQPIAARVADLLPRMTVQEKIQQTWTTHTSAATAKQWANIGVGAVKYMSAFTCDPSEIGKCIEQRNALQEEFINSSRLGIPISFVNEGLHGGAPGGTIFPMPVGLGSSWNVDLVRSVMGVVGNEAARIGVDVVFAPVVNMMTDPRFGRLQEGYSSNPLLTSHLAVAAVLALQGCEGNATAATCGPKAYLNASGVGALGKHYAAYGASEGGLNGGPAAISNRTLHEVFLRPWKAMAEVGLRACMPSHNTVLDVPAHASKWLIDTTLRGTFGFEGVALSDCNDIGVIYDFRMATNRTAAAALALNAGTTWDLQCGTDPEQWGYNKIADALADGLVSDATLDETVRTVLTLKFSHGLFDGRAFVSAADIASVGAFLDRAAHRALARTAAQQSMVLLLNRGAEALGDGQRGGDRGALPWATLPKKIALIGPTVTTSTCEDSVIGAYVLEGANVVCLDAALDAAGVAYSVSGAVDTTAPTVQDADVSEADAAAIASAVAAVNDPLTTAAIVVLGDLSGKVCGEWGDRDDLTLSGAQLPLLKAVVAAAAARNGNRSATGRSAPPRFSVVVVLTHGRPQTFGDATSGGGEPLLAQLDALVAAWRPGEEFGNALLDLLTGAVSPSAKLSHAWPRTVGHVHSGATPWLQRVAGKWVSNRRGTIDPDGRRYDAYSTSNFDPTPLFRFGFGLSYTTFALAQLAVSACGAGTEVLWRVHLNVANTGAHSGATVVQVYVQDPRGLPFVPYWKRLVAFARVDLAAGASSDVTIDVRRDDVAMYDDAATGDFALELFEGVYALSVGTDSEYALLAANVTVGRG